ncbi:phage holin family protein [Pectobacterium polaris]|uniref:phage holin family protein n=1 Tax=Pectobacterium polaris TaxID=2042057 RepID=UPI000D61E54D|nr:phage holin family protein [Pectobacterium polaris]MCU1787504.1 phage holin family protein [Pectobacterium polaris]PWD55463.1 phage holin family protein [Pectobacterium polaris]
MAALVNVIICAVIVVLLMFYRKNGARHRPLISWLAYLLILVYASVPFRYLFGYYDAGWLVVAVNLIICAAMLKARGNVARLIDALRY